MTSRRSFIKKGSLAAGGAWLGTLNSCETASSKTVGSLGGPNMALGHKLRELTAAAPTETIREDIVVVGGGVSGLSAGRWLNKHGYSFRLLELEGEVGGNSRSGSNRLGRFPLGAHYIPLPSIHHHTLIEFLQECKVITGFENKLPVFNDFHLCFDPKERLFIEHHWQEGLIPNEGLSIKERDDIKRFHGLVHQYREAVGKDGKMAFDIPLDESSRDEEFRKLDKITMRQLLKDNNMNSEPLHWYVNYCCADDFGSGIDETSAWAGIHYFASRKGQAANAVLDDVITWPEGNAYLVDHLKVGIEQRIHPGCVALGVSTNGNSAHVDYFDSNSNSLKRIESKAVIVAIPTFAARHIVREKRELNYESFQYAPWMVANLTVNSWLNERRGEPLAWDNVIYGSDSLGYVASQHQHLETASREKNITYYRALTGNNAAAVRKVAAESTWDTWRDSIFADLRLAHPGIEDAATQMDVWIWGHGMIRPAPGLIWGSDRLVAQLPVENKIFFAHSDLSGISLFEEGFERGIKAATALMNSI